MYRAIAFDLTAISNRNTRATPACEGGSRVGFADKDNVFWRPYLASRNRILAPCASSARQASATSPVHEGWIARTLLAEACAALWIEGEPMHLEGLVLHDIGMEIRGATHALIRAHASLRALQK